MFKVIRVSEDQEVVLIQEVASAEKDGPGEGQVYLRRVAHPLTEDWEPINDTSALAYCSGIADGLGWGKKPEIPFQTLAEATRWMDRAVLLHRIAFFERMLNARTGSMSPAELNGQLERMRTELATLDAAGLK